MNCLLGILFVLSIILLIIIQFRQAESPRTKSNYGLPPQTDNYSSSKPFTVWDARREIEEISNDLTSIYIRLSSIEKKISKLKLDIKEDASAQTVHHTPAPEPIPIRESIHQEITDRISEEKSPAEKAQEEAVPSSGLSYQEEPAPAVKESLEVIFGKYWLNRVGVLVFSWEFSFS